MLRSISISILSFFLALYFCTVAGHSKNLVDNAPDFIIYQGCFSREEIEIKIENALKKDKEISEFFHLDNEGLKIFSSKEDKKLRNPEFVLYFGEKEKPHSTHFSFSDNPSKPLQGLRVAIDPGHIGGSFSRLEERYIHMKPKEDKRIYDEIFFNEGELAIITAKKLQQKLKALGAQVFLTKSEEGASVLKKDFTTWLQEDYSKAISLMVTRQKNPTIQEKEKDYWEKKASKSEIFRSTYNYLDVEKRAELINDFNPHVTVTCHFNLGGVYDAKGYTPGTDDDYTLFFVAGAFKKGDQKDEYFRHSSLNHPRSRYEFVRLLVTDDLEQSVLLAKLGKKNARSLLNLPTGDHCNYLKVLCLKSEEGIYHRNLALTRLVRSPLLYCEPFCQDNYSQALEIYENPNDKLNQVAELYLKTILDWVSANSYREIPRSTSK